VLAGCFLIGALILLRDWPVLSNTGTPAPPVALSESDQVLLRVLYAVTTACLLGALALAVLGVTGLWRVLNAR
jgi:hypothetical protein